MQEDVKAECGSEKGQYMKARMQGRRERVQVCVQGRRERVSGVGTGKKRKGFRCGCREEEKRFQVWVQGRRERVSGEGTYLACIQS